MRCWQVVVSVVLMGCSNPTAKLVDVPVPRHAASAWRMPALPVAPAPVATLPPVVTSALDPTAVPSRPPPRVRLLPFRSGCPDCPAVPGGARRAALRPIAKRFKRCYENSLKADPNAHGKVELVVRLAPDGRVQQVSATTTNPALEFMLPCLKAVLQSASFPPHLECEDHLTIPVWFVPGR